VEIRDLLSELLEALGFEVHAPAEVDDLGPLTEIAPAAVITDLRRTGHESDITHIERLRANHVLGNVPILACTGDVHALRRHRRRLKQLRVATMSRPFSLEELERRIKQLLEDSSDRS
jgi:CheY-like chemotaxis protein